MISPPPSGRADWTGPKAGDALTVNNLIFSQLSQIREILCCAKSANLLSDHWKARGRALRWNQSKNLLSLFIIASSAHPNCLFGGHKGREGVAYDTKSPIGESCFLTALRK